MKILVTGGNGYIAKSLVSGLSNQYDVTSITRLDFDLTAFQAMNNFFSNKYYDVVIHCAVQGGSRLRVDTYKDMDVNLVMYYNLLQHKPHFNKLIHFGSGAELNNPSAPYGLSKRVIANSISETDNFYNARIYGVFDENELDTRFIKASLINYINKRPITLHENKEMDFIYMKDLVELVNFLILNNTVKSVDCCYNQKYSLLEIANIINNLGDYQVPVNVGGVGKPYIGNGNLPINVIGLEQGIKDVYTKLLTNENITRLY